MGNKSLLIFIVLVVGAVGVYWAAVDDTAAVPAAPVELSGSVPDDTPPVRLATTITSESTSPFEVVDDEVALRDYWFVGQDDFALQEPDSGDASVHIDRQCAGQTGIKPTLNVRENLRQRLALRLSAQLEEEAFFTERTRFWELDGTYYQMTAVWDRDMPATYRLEFYQSPSPDFDREVSLAEPPPGMPQSVDALSALEFVDHTLRDYQARGAVSGGKILVTRVIDQAARESHELTFLNDALINWSFNQGLCLMNAEFNQLDCRCEETQRDDHHH